MNHDAASSSSARIPDRLSPPGVGAHADADDAEADADARDRPQSRQRSRSSSGRQRRRRRSKRKQNPGLAKKLAFLTHLLKTLDLVLFAELSSLYYMDYPTSRPFDTVAQPAVHGIASFGSLPTGPDYHRGYQHGGMVIDFIGQMPAAYRLYYLMADLLILFLQCLMLTVHNHRESLRVALKTFRPLLSEVLLEPIAGRTAEDLDAEERGVSRHVPGMMINETDEIELQQLDRQGDGEGSEERNEQPGAAGGDGSDEPPRTHLSDIMSSGNAVLNEYHIIHTIKNAAVNTGGSTALSLQSIGYRATMASVQGRRRGATLQTSLARPTG
ncbi:hypothetical protein TrVFT333_007258 [Trichoderma virens FT-333]|nr:hypothetical protein TrVFT333_007258 [Trichoderma virens FT-333]